MQSNSNDDVTGFDNHKTTEPSNKNPKDDNDDTSSTSTSNNNNSDNDATPSSSNNNDDQDETTDIEPEDTSSATKYYTKFFSRITNRTLTYSFPLNLQSPLSTKIAFRWSNLSNMG